MNCEIYVLECPECSATIRIPTDAAPFCPHCGALLHIEWDAERAKTEPRS